jgi:hypothetical protein
MSGPPSPPRGTWRIDLVDGVAIVVGYGLAALLFRAFWPSAGVSPALGCFAIGFYCWLGLAMSGPLLLWRHGEVGEAAPEPPGGRAAAGSRTWAEIAWLVIGVYWIVLGVFVLPLRLHDFRLGDTVLFGSVPLLTGLVLRFFGPRPTHGRRPEDRRRWTHHAAVALLVTWPMAWVCLIVLGEEIL